MGRVAILLLLLIVAMNIIFTAPVVVWFGFPGIIVLFVVVFVVAACSFLIANKPGDSFGEGLIAWLLLGYAGSIIVFYICGVLYFHRLT